MAFAALIVAAYPSVVVSVGGCVGSLFAIAAIIFAYGYATKQPSVKIIEREYYFALGPGTNRRELWDAVASRKRLSSTVEAEFKYVDK